MRSLLGFLVLLFLTSSASRAHAIDYLWTTGSCDGNGNASLHWTYYEDGSNDMPQWVGYDLLRRPVVECGAFERVNEEILPRTVGVTHTTDYMDGLPTSYHTYEYRVVLVDAQRQEIGFPLVTNDTNQFVSCPAYSAPVAMGTINGDLGWALTFSSCPDSPCQTSGIIEGNAADALRPFTGTGTVIRLFGDVQCGGVEGCAIQVIGWDFGACGVTSVPVVRTTVGSLKTRYR